MRDKVVEWICPSCGKIYSAKSIAHFLKGDPHPRCTEDEKHLVRKVTKK